VIVLDTDHMVVLKYSTGPQFASLKARMTASPDQEFVTTCVTVEEQLRGWAALLNRTRERQRQVAAYHEHNKLIDYFAYWQRLEYDEQSADLFDQFRGQGIRIGTMDLRIASICIANNATLLSANIRDYQQVPGLRVEDWLKA
jgi:tRNA(fMet)-specific endonuclease VapC